MKPSRKVKKRGRRIVIGLLLATALIAVIQHWAESTDHQFANMFTILILIAVSIQVVWNLHWIVVQKGKRWHVPLAGLLVAFITSMLFDFEGFSGELIPQIRFTLSKTPPSLQEIPASEQIPLLAEEEEQR